MSDIAIQISGLGKTFGSTKAVDGIDLEIRRGELFGLVGPDGAGKTTIMRMLSSIMLPSAGDATVAGHSISTGGERIKEKIGYMSQRFGLYEDLTVSENLEFYADLYDVPGQDRPGRTERLLGFSNLTPFRSRLAGQLSGGMKQKLGLACALIHTPEVLFLDEPTNGVDPVSRRDFWKILYELLHEGITIVVTTSYLDEAERCTRVGLIDKGRLLVVDEPANIKKRVSLPMIQLWIQDTRPAVEALTGMAGIRAISSYGDSIHVVMENQVMEDAILARLAERGIPVEGSREIAPSLEDVFIMMVSGQ